MVQGHSGTDPDVMCRSRAPVARDHAARTARRHPDRLHVPRPSSSAGTGARVASGGGPPPAGSDTVTSSPVGRDRESAYGHLDPLLAEFAATAADDPRRRQLREELATGFWPVVVHIARRYRDRGEPVADLQQVGAVGLLGALERFDPGRGVDFLGFAVPTITGEIRRHFRDRTWSMRVPRRLKDLQAPIRDAVAALTASLHRAPRPSEIAAHLDVTVEEILDALTAQHAHSPHSLDEVVRGSGDTPALGDLVGAADTALIAAGYRHDLRRAITALPERERAILIMRFFGDLTQTQIAERVGVSQMHISRLLSQTLATLRARIDDPDRGAER